MAEVSTNRVGLEKKIASQKSSGKSGVGGNVAERNVPDPYLAAKKQEKAPKIGRGTQRWLESELRGREKQGGGLVRKESRRARMNEGPAPSSLRRIPKETRGGRSLVTLIDTSRMGRLKGQVKVG